MFFGEPILDRRRILASRYLLARDQGSWLGSRPNHWGRGQTCQSWGRHVQRWTDVPFFAGWLSLDL
jgi:hypothetical protein